MFYGCFVEWMQEDMNDMMDMDEYEENVKEAKVNGMINAKDEIAKE